MGERSIGRRARLLYMAATFAWAIVACGLAAAHLWVLGAACMLMAAVMTAASLQMLDRPGDLRRHRRRGRYQGLLDPRD